MEQNVDVYRNIHKAIRAELFAVTGTAGSIDAGDECARVALAGRIGALADLLELHAEHEDHFIQPLVEVHAPQFVEGIVTDHAMLDATIAGIAKASAEATSRADLHELHLDLARFTSSYLRHQDVEERDLQPALLATAGPAALFEAEQRLVASIPPPTMAASLAIMLPAMNLDDRAELLGGMRMGAPAEVFAGVCALAQSVLEPTEMAALSGRLGL